MTIRILVIDDHPMVRAGVRAELENSGADLEVVGDMRPGPGELALVAALAEACQNAVRHGAPPVSVYVEVRPQAVEAFIKDSGEGFDPASIAADRHGVRDSIVGRMRRTGGNATIRRLARGTEVALSVPRSDILEETAPNGRTQ